MSELDFQKIFASGASSQIDWTDDNYLKGWGYLGNVPPSYQSFDSLQRLNDLKFKYLYDEFMGIETNTEELISNHNENSEAHKTLFDKKLDKNGGTVTGNLNASGYNITATKFIGNLQGKADSATNADLATKANQDSQGQVINTTYVKGVTASNATLTLTKGNGTTSTVTINNVGNSTRATQDKNGKDITGYLYKTEDLTLNSNAEILTVGNISEILNSFCTKFKQIQGIGTYAENSPTSIKSLNDNKAPKSSPAFSGTPTSPTPATSDNSTKIATTEFVRNLINQFKNDGTLGGIVGGSLTQNGWVKFSNGLILQWGSVKGVANGKQYNFPISFINNILGAATNKNWRGGYGSADGNSAGIELINKTSFYAYGDDGSPNVNYIVIGY